MAHVIVLVLVSGDGREVHVFDLGCSSGSRCRQIGRGRYSSLALERVRVLTWVDSRSRFNLSVSTRSVYAHVPDAVSYPSVRHASDSSFVID